MITQLKTAIDKYLLPIFIGLIPFLPDLQAWFNKPDIDYVYQVEYSKNPLLEWDRQISKFISRLEELGAESKSNPTKSLLQKIGQEFYHALPTMVANIGVKPFDRYSVKIANLSSEDLTEIRVHFIGCVGFDSFRTYPDTFGEIETKAGQQSDNPDNVTISYRKLLRRSDNSYNTATIAYYGHDTSKCEPVVEAFRASGESAKGIKKNIASHIRTIQTESYDRERAWSYIWRVLLSAVVIFLYFKYRGLQKIVART